MLLMNKHVMPLDDGFLNIYFFYFISNCALFLSMAYDKCVLFYDDDWQRLLLINEWVN